MRRRLKIRKSAEFLWVSCCVRVDKGNNIQGNYSAVPVFCIGSLREIEMQLHSYGKLLRAFG